MLVSGSVDSHRFASTPKVFANKKPFETNAAFRSKVVSAAAAQTRLDLCKDSPVVVQIFELDTGTTNIIQCFNMSISI